MPLGVTGKDATVALCGLFNQDEVLNRATEIRRRGANMRSIRGPVDYF